ncbi:MAG: DUF11 domain-containing protein [Dehalococcoidia bacterium]|nr:DUF11 domain-containing protein [Dehalococcoidia bacterium]
MGTRPRWLAAGVTMLIVALASIVTASAAVTPAATSLTVAAGSSGSTTVQIDVPAGPASSPLTEADIEIAIDTTGSMFSGIAQAKADAAALVAGVQAQIPNARFSVVQFRDRLDAPEYRVEQSLTTDASLVSAALGRLTAGGGGDAPEAHNLVYTQAAQDVGSLGAIGWSPTAAKFVIVLSDAQPHGAGAAGVTGCTDVSSDPFGLNTKSSLAALAAASRTLFMVLEPGAISASLDCYQFLALQVSPASRGFTGGSSLAAQLVPLITGTTSEVANLRLAVASASPDPGAASWVSTSPSSFGPLPLPASVTSTVNVNVPSGAAAGTYTYDLVALADGLDVGHVALTLNVTAGGGGGVPGGTPTPDNQKRNRGGATTSGPDVQITGSASTGSPAPGAQYRYTYQVKNNSGSTATSVLLEDSLPTDVTVVGVTTTGGVCSAAGVQVACNLGSLAVGGQQTVVVTVQAPAAPGPVTNTATVSLAEVDTKPANNSLTIAVTVK